MFWKYLLMISVFVIIFLIVVMSRVQFIQDYTLKSMRLKPDKWAKLVISDEQRRHLEHFIEKGEV